MLVFRFSGVKNNKTIMEVFIVLIQKKKHFN